MSDFEPSHLGANFLFRLQLKDYLQLLW